MEQRVDAMEMLGLMVRPAFCVQENRIIGANEGARNLGIQAGSDIRPLLLTGKTEYESFASGRLYLTLSLGGLNLGMSVSRIGGMDVFVLEQDDDLVELRAMALAARELREPLSSVMTTADRLFPVEAQKDDPATREQVARINRGLLQMLRIISNMSDAARYASAPAPRQETVDVRRFLEDIFRRASELITHGGQILTFRNLSEPLLCLIDPEQLERAVLNILSNAIKFTPSGGRIDASLTRQGNMLHLQIQDSGSGIAKNLRGTVYSRYQRTPSLEDGRHGIGLGMVLIRSAATSHGGTLLIDQPEGTGTRITMTLAIRQRKDTAVRSPMLRIDYAGERDHCLLELSDVLPTKLYEVEPNS